MTSYWSLIGYFQGLTWSLTEEVARAAVYVELSVRQLGWMTVQVEAVTVGLIPDAVVADLGQGNRRIRGRLGLDPSQQSVMVEVEESDFRAAPEHPLIRELCIGLVERQATRDGGLLTRCIVRPSYSGAAISGKSW
jgi:hypothetical protein